MLTHFRCEQSPLYRHLDDRAHSHEDDETRERERGVAAHHRLELVGADGRTGIHALRE